MKNSHIFKRGDRVARYHSYRHGTVIWSNPNGCTLVAYDFYRKKDKETELELTNYLVPVEAGSDFEFQGNCSRLRVQWGEDPDEILNDVNRIIKEYDSRKANERPRH